MVYFLAHPYMWAIPWICQSIGYYFVLKKMGLNQYTAIIPCLAEREFCKVLMRRMRSFYRPFVIAVIFIAGAYYLDPYAGLGRLYLEIALAVYGLFLMRLYWRLCNSFQKSVPFYIGMIFFAPIFLLILGLGKSQYQPLELEPLPAYDKGQKNLRRVGFWLVSLVEVIALVFGVGYVTNTRLMFPFMVKSMIQGVNQNLANMKVTDSYIANTDVINDQQFMDSLEPSREHFFPDHSGDKDVIVYVYFVGSDLEGRNGLGTINIDQMLDATKQGSNLKFVLEVGGSKRWFTKGINDGSYGRYEIENGVLTKIEDLPSDTNLSEEQSLEDFLTWCRDNYNADRNMLVFWDHGGGFTMGYGSDNVNVTKDFNLLSSTDIITAIEASGLKFDMIGFDACLMQDIELGALLEPYTDYLLASEEVEGGFGWYYTTAFGKLAKDPTIDTKEFFKEILSSYDAYNMVFAGTEGPQMNTLSVVDTTLVKPAYEQLNELWVQSDEAIRNDPKAFSYISTALNNSYKFDDNLSIDLIGYLNALDGIDYDDVVYPHDQIEKLIKMLQAGVIYRNENTFDGVNGIAVTFPYFNIKWFTFTNEQLKNFSLDDQSAMLSDMFSIIAYKQTEQHDAQEHLDYWQAIESAENYNAWIEDITFEDLTKEDWYVAGFENYDTSPAILDIPLIEQEKGYRIDLPDNVWDIMLDCQTMVFKQNEDGSVVYLGSDHFGEDDENGHPLINFDGNWVHINGQTVCYETQGVRESEKGDVFYGQVPAMLNGEEEILINIEWDVKDGDTLPKGRVVGYDYPQNEEQELISEKGTLTLKAGDSLQFMFQTYDAEGNLIGYEPSGKTIRVTKQERLKVEDSSVEAGTYAFNALLRDVYHRDFVSEPIIVNIK